MMPKRIHRTTASITAALMTAALSLPSQAENCRTSTVRGAYRFEGQMQWAQGTCRSVGWMYFDGMGHVQTVDEKVSGRCPDSARTQPVANFRYAIDEDCNGAMHAANGARIDFEVLPAGLLQFTMEAPNLQLEGQARYHHPLTASERRRLPGGAPRSDVPVVAAAEPTGPQETVIVPTQPTPRSTPGTTKPAPAPRSRPNDIIVTPSPARP